MNPSDSGAQRPVDEHDALTTILRAPPPPGIAALPSESRDDLAALVEEVTRKRIEELTVAALGALDNVPVFLRGAVRKAVGL
ncbi:hypothetical protein [Nocardia aurea]|uniref:hypothetical protein n=1 Tax=Nocardia aurea TaxID=2144174 RepID=UPI0033A9D229